METADSDGDGYTNLDEVRALTFPGNVEDYPGLVPAPTVGMSLERILKLPDHSQLLFLNASNSQDFYARYAGVRIIDLLKYVGVSKNAAQITVFSPDGFSKTFPINAPDPQTDPANIQYDVMGPYPYGTYYGGLDFVGYSFTPLNLDQDDKIPDKLYMLLAYLRDGDPLTPGKINSSGKLDGEGPYRLIPPQKIAGSPDRSCKNAPIGDLDCDDQKDHNAGSSIRTVSAIRVEPLPPGTTDFNVFEGGWNLVDKAKIVIYGAIEPRTYPVESKVLNGSGKGVPDVKLAFSLLSLGKVGEAMTSSNRGHFWRRFRGGNSHIDLPAGEYTVVPSKEGCTFEPASLSISIPDAEFGRRFDRSRHWDDFQKFEINFTASCQE
jgi:hypothetical protein